MLGIRSDVAAATPALRERPESFLLRKLTRKVGVSAALAGLPELRSRLSKEPDSQEAWIKAVKESPSALVGWRVPLRAVTILGGVSLAAVPPRVNPVCITGWQVQRIHFVRICSVAGHGAGP